METMVFSPAMAAAILTAVLVGAILQRISGTGMGLILAPTLTILLGAGPGVLLSNATTMVSALLLTLTLWRDANWRRVGLICLFAVPGSLVGAWIVRHTSAAWLQVLVGAVVIAALGITVLASSLGRLPHVRAPWVTPTAGFLGAVFNTAAGVSAPVMVVHSRLVRWDQESFGASMQPVFMTMGALSVTVKLTLSSAHIELPPWWLIIALVLTVVVGIVVGTRLARRIAASQASKVAIALAALGGFGALIRGVIALW